MALRRLDLVGQQIGRLNVIEEAKPLPSIGWGPVRRYRCLCVCGRHAIVRQDRLRGSPPTQSCGCLHRERFHGTIVHHESHRTPEYAIWCDMKKRCSNRKAQNYKYYGGRGIKVCNRWLHSYPNFLVDMGRRPSPVHTIERLDNEGHYEPNNCCWATWKVQRANRRDSAGLGVS